MDDDYPDFTGLIDCVGCPHFDMRWRGLKLFLVCAPPAKPRAIIDIMRTHRDNISTIRPNCSPEKGLLMTSLPHHDSMENHDKSRI